MTDGATGGGPGGDDSPISVPELRDYHQINAEVVRRLQRGASRVRLDGPAGHRLLLAGLAGPWNAVVEILGNAGPELAAGMDAPGVTVVCRGTSADGAAAGLKAGTVLLLDGSGSAAACRQSGGLVVAADAVGPRAGLGMTGGDLVLLGPVGPMAGDRQSGGRILLPDRGVGPNAGRQAGGGERLIAGSLDAGSAAEGLLSRALDLRSRFVSSASGRPSA